MPYADTEENGVAHQHLDKNGFMVDCYHRCKQNWLGFVVGLTFSFPFEHLLWEKIWPFKLFTEWMHNL